MDRGPFRFAGHGRTAACGGGGAGARRRVERRLTEARGHATELAATASEGDVVVVFGGDGAVNEVLNGLAPGVLLGAIPGGGTSVFARALGQPRDPAAAAERVAAAIVARRTRRITLGRVDGRRFGFAAGLGFDARPCGRSTRARSRAGRPPSGRSRVRVRARARAGRGPLQGRAGAQLQGHGRAAAVFVANCDPYTYAGAIPLHVAPDARFELGLDLVAPVRIAPRTLPRLARYVMRGKGQQGAAGRALRARRRPDRDRGRPAAAAAGRRRGSRRCRARRVRGRARCGPAFSPSDPVDSLQWRRFFLPSAICGA